MKVLVGYDGSDGAKRALKFAQKLGKVVVIYVIDERDISWPARIDLSLIWDKNLEELESSIREARMRYAKDLLKNIKASKKIIEIGNVAETIAKKAEKLKCSLIVLGLGTKLPFYVGSTTEKVIKISKVPVVVVP